MGFRPPSGGVRRRASNHPRPHRTHSFALLAVEQTDGRGPKDIRPIWAQVDFSPRAHGSGLFTRGETQVLTMATLGTPRDAQELDNLSPVDS